MVATARTPKVRSTTKTARRSTAEEPVAGLTRAPFAVAATLMDATQSDSTLTTEITTPVAAAVIGPLLVLVGKLRWMVIIAVAVGAGSTTTASSHSICFTEENNNSQRTRYEINFISYFISYIPLYNAGMVY